MATSVMFEHTALEGDGSTYYTAHSIGLDGFSCFVYVIYTTSSGAYAEMKAAGLARLFPNATAHPYKADMYAACGIISLGGGLRVRWLVDGTELLNKSVGSSQDIFEVNDITDPAILNATKSSKIRWYITHGSLAGGGVGYERVRFYFWRYDFSAVSGEGIASASVSSATGYDGDTVTFTATVRDGCAWDGWYVGDTKVSSSQSYTHTVNGSDLALTAKAVSLYTNLYEKENGVYSRVKDVYKKVNGVYVKQDNIPALFPEGVKLLRMGIAIAMYGIALNGGADGIHADPLTCVTDYLPVPAGCTNITVYPGGSGSASNSVVHEYAADKSYLSYWGNTGAERTFSFDYPAQIKYIRATFVIAQIDNCYIIDNTHGQYIYRGKNV